MNNGFIQELKQLMASGFTGQIILHVDQGSIKKYELHEWRRPKAEDGPVELTEVGKGRSVDAPLG